MRITSVRATRQHLLEKGPSASPLLRWPRVAPSHFISVLTGRVCGSARLLGRMVKLVRWRPKQKPYRRSGPDSTTHQATVDISPFRKNACQPSNGKAREKQETS